jgi:hypothetical protein
MLITYTSVSGKRPPGLKVPPKGQGDNFINLRILINAILNIVGAELPRSVSAEAIIEGDRPTAALAIHGLVKLLETLHRARQSQSFPQGQTARWHSISTSPRSESATRIDEEVSRPRASPRALRLTNPSLVVKDSCRDTVVFLHVQEAARRCRQTGLWGDDCCRGVHRAHTHTSFARTHARPGE